jgi:8-oxo-dGTP diphosphatase
VVRLSKLNTNLKNKEVILKKLEKNLVKNISIINLIKNGFYKDYYSINDAVLVRRSKRPKCFLSSSDEENILMLINEAKKHKLLENKFRRFSAVEDSIVTILNKKYKLKLGNFGYRMILSEDRSLPKVKHKSQPITLSHAKLINSYWEDHNSLDYIEQCIRYGIGGFIIYDKKVPVSWVLTHFDGSIGFLYVKDEYRKQGYGTTVTISLIKKLRQRKETVFASVMENNLPSLNMFERLGFVKGLRIGWFTMEE